MQQEIDALKIAFLQGDDEAGQAAAVAMLGAFALLFERGVKALETLASAVDTHDRPTTVRTRDFS